MKMADYGLDLHSGGSSLHYLPSAIGSAGTDDDAVRVRELMKVFGAPYSIFLPGRHAGGGAAMTVRLDRTCCPLALKWVAAVQ